MKRERERVGEKTSGGGSGADRPAVRGWCGRREREGDRVREREGESGREGDRVKVRAELGKGRGRGRGSRAGAAKKRGFVCGKRKKK